jgi:hypothetical protein
MRSTPRCGSPAHRYGRVEVDCLSDGFVDRSKQTGEVRDRHIRQGLGHSINHSAVLAILPFRQTRNDASSNRLRLTQPAMGLRRLRPGLGFEQCAIITNVRRIDPVGLLRPNLVRTKSQIWAGFSLPQGGGIDYAPSFLTSMTSAWPPTSRV